MACANHGPRSLCGPSCDGWIHPARPRPDAPKVDVIVAAPTSSDVDLAGAEIRIVKTDGDNGDK